MSLELANEGQLRRIAKRSVTIAVTLGCRLIVGATMLAEEAVGGGVEVGGNLLDISDFPTSCMLLTGRHGLLRERQ